VDLRRPILDGFTGFIVTGKMDVGAELHIATFALEATVQLFAHGLKARRGDGGQVASGQFGVEAGQLGGEGLEAILPGGDGAIHEILPFDGAQVLDEVLVFLAPADEGGLGNAKLLGDAREALALGAQLDELLNGFIFGHNRLSYFERRRRYRPH
jgi:hypothetical protein